MFSKTILTAAIIFGTASVALATEQDPNLANRYAGFNGPAAAQTFQSTPVSLQTVGGSQVIIDRASSPAAGGVG